MLGRIALRICAVEALKGKTLVLNEVLDSRMSALDQDSNGALKTEQEKPFISVYCEGSTFETEHELRALHHSGMTDLVLEFGIAASMAILDPDTDETVVVPGIPATDGGLEFYLDVCGRQAVTALTDPDNPWAELFRRLTLGVGRVERKRASNANEGVRLAAHQWVIRCSLMEDPIFGEPLEPEGAWRAFFDLLEAEGHEYAEPLKSLVGFSGSAPTSSDVTRRELNLSLDEARALAIAQPDGFGGQIQGGVLNGDISVVAPAEPTP